MKKFLVLRNWHGPARDCIVQTFTHLNINFNNIHIVFCMLDTEYPFLDPSLTTLHALCVDFFASENFRLCTPTKSKEFAVLGKDDANITTSHRLFKYRNVLSRYRLYLDRAYILTSKYCDEMPSTRKLNDGKYDVGGAQWKCKIQCGKK